jgi:hypothetical protein
MFLSAASLPSQWPNMTARHPFSMLLYTAMSLVAQAATVAAFQDGSLLTVIVFI